MAQNGKNTFSGVKIQQKPGGNSNFSLDWDILTPMTRQKGLNKKHQLTSSQRNRRWLKR